MPLLVGLLCYFSPVGNWFANLSYDLLFLFKPSITPKEAVIVYMDEKSYHEMRQQPATWNRALHARLLDRLTEDQARAVVFDIVFENAMATETDELLRHAIATNGKVVLAAAFSSEPRPGMSSLSLVLPYDRFLDVAESWGIAELPARREDIKRQLLPNSEFGFSLPWAAARASGGNPSENFDGKGWLNYYGPHGTIPNISYSDAASQLPGFFRDKVVFVGSKPIVQYAFAQADELRTPYSRWGGASFPGVEVITTAYLNIHRKETLAALHPAWEMLLLALSAFGFGWAAERPQAKHAVLLMMMILFVLLGLVLVLFVWLHSWFSWLLLLGVPLPVAISWVACTKLITAKPAPDLSPFTTHDGKRRVPNVPDHKLIRRIGVGGYGEVWLARNTIGLYRAIKYVFKDRYSSAEPYEREFRGIENYMPISLNHPLLVDVLHVGKNEARGYFFYIMEAADDETTGQDFAPETYHPRNLHSELRRRGRLPIHECMSLGLQLSEAIGFLHGNGLIHRDIKPANIIYIRGIPKVADIGLVTEVHSAGKTVTYVGTDGYIPPEGPGMAGDVYGLGKVLYEVAMGHDRQDYPNLPTSIIEGRAEPGILELNEVILRACESNPLRRFQTAKELHAALLGLSDRLQRS